MTYQPLMPNRMINLNNYWITNDWFPFTNNTGFISDQKSVLSVGSLISPNFIKAQQTRRF